MRCEKGLVASERVRKVWVESELPTHLTQRASTSTVPLILTHPPRDLMCMLSEAKHDLCSVVR